MLKAKDWSSVQRHFRSIHHLCMNDRKVYVEADLVFVGLYSSWYLEIKTRWSGEIPHYRFGVICTNRVNYQLAPGLLWLRLSPGMLGWLLILDARTMLEAISIYRKTGMTNPCTTIAKMFCDYSWPACLCEPVELAEQNMDPLKGGRGSSFAL